MKKLLLSLAAWIIKACEEKKTPVLVLKKRHYLSGYEEFSESFRAQVKEVWEFIKGSKGDVVLYRGSSAYQYDTTKSFDDYQRPCDTAEPPVAPIGDFSKSPIKGLHGQSV